MIDYKNILAKAIRDFFTADEILSEDFVKEAAANWVYEHDEEIKSALMEDINLDEEFSYALDSLNFWEIF